MLVNGSPRPDIAVRSGERLRLRLINATTAETFLGGHHARWQEIERIAFMADKIEGRVLERLDTGTAVRFAVG
jgi:hypothetical protein